MVINKAPYIDSETSTELNRMTDINNPQNDFDHISFVDYDIGKCNKL